MHYFQRNTLVFFRGTSKTPAVWHVRFLARVEPIRIILSLCANGTKDTQHTVLPETVPLLNDNREKTE